MEKFRTVLKVLLISVIILVVLGFIFRDYLMNLIDAIMQPIGPGSLPPDLLN